MIQVSILSTLSQESSGEGSKVDRENKGRDVPECSVSGFFWVMIAFLILQYLQ